MPKFERFSWDALERFRLNEAWTKTILGKFWTFLDYWNRKIKPRNTAAEFENICITK